MSNKTLVGKNNILFLSSGEIELHCNNKYNKKNTKISEYNFNNFFITVFPDKSVYYKQYLPDVYKSMYRPSLEIYKLKFNDKLFDAYETLCNVDDAYYKTDSHINFYGSYLVFLEFIKRINNIYNLKIESKNIEISVLKNINITNLNRGIGDLTWSHNLGNIILENTEDNYYYSNDVLDFYTKYKINDENNIRFLNYELNDDTTKLIDTIVDWNIISNYIIYIKNDNIVNKSKIVIFYDSFFLVGLQLYIDIFYEAWFIKDVYNNNLINKINPDYVFEFRVERFLL